MGVFLSDCFAYPLSINSCPLCIYVDFINIYNFFQEVTKIRSDFSNGFLEFSVERFDFRIYLWNDYIFFDLLKNMLRYFK